MHGIESSNSFVSHWNIVSSLEHDFPQWHEDLKPRTPRGNRRISLSMNKKIMSLFACFHGRRKETQRKAFSKTRSRIRLMCHANLVHYVDKQIISEQNSEICHLNMGIVNQRPTDCYSLQNDNSSLDFLVVSSLEDVLDRRMRHGRFTTNSTSFPFANICAIYGDTDWSFYSSFIPNL
jgi:hypothetical protein